MKIERNHLSAVEPILSRLFDLILTIEVISQIHNGLIPINLRHIGCSKGKEWMLAELSKNPRLKHTVYSGLINCSLSEHKGMNPFFVCCALGRKEIFDFMKSFDPDINSSDVTGTLCMHAAVRSMNEPIISSLLEMNANCTTPNKFGETPLMCACSAKLEKSALQLINKLNSTNSLENQKALSVACQNGLIEVARKLLSKGVSKTFI